MTTAIEQAQEILALDTLPLDARARFKALEAEIEEFIMEDLWEGLQLREGMQGQFEEGDVDLTS